MESFRTCPGTWAMPALSEHTPRSKQKDCGNLRQGSNEACSVEQGQGEKKMHHELPWDFSSVLFFLSRNMWWKIKQHLFNLRLSSSPCCNYILDTNGNRCSASKLRIIYLLNIPVIQNTDWEAGIWIYMEWQMKEFLEHHEAQRILMQTWGGTLNRRRQTGWIPARVVLITAISL